MKRSITKLFYLFIFMLFVLLLNGFTTTSYTRKAEPIPNMPEDNPDLNQGIVVRSNSTGRDIARDSSKNIRFAAFRNYEKTEILQLRSSSIVDRTPKKFKFLDEKHGVSSDNIYEFSIFFNSDNYEWMSISFMPFASVIEWVTEEKLRIYLDEWIKKFEEAGWQRVEYPKTDDPSRIQNFSLPTPKYGRKQYCALKTKNYKAVMDVMLRESSYYSSYIPKKDRKNIKEIPNGYIAFIHIRRNDT